MKKSTFISSLAFICLLLVSTNVDAQKFAKLDKSPLDVTAYPTSNKEPNKIVKIVYSRPQLKGRELSKLAPNDKIWRTGANEAPVVTFYKDMKVDGKTVKAGEYSLFTIPGESAWTIILSKDVNVWGAYAYNEANDVLRVQGKVTTANESIEAFSMAFDEDGTLYLAWDKTRVSVPFTK
ncbi:DUF2911 domain-containing protein [Tamlana sp. 2_MG-2023]|uniref:DUF2911 domain-containing protein n=1 Tax=unclassified Tamlana TaxID=2614803 RepID=UPI0026E31CB9|nr:MULTISPECIES: DUF2911 domain-containing protein [unclassified Tamlana]MDO6760802.1 DUF2911 domain-containing protein [Tamlana sp. 2_MG-2023]MDO6791058.1 DUF2911 domain-containing protein [Tamlana sp. 1_MG-2023]